VIARHVLECFLGSGLLEGVSPEDARGTGIAIEAQLDGRKSIAEFSAVWNDACESPIEKAMCTALHYARWRRVPVEICGQVPLGKYRLDFLVKSGKHQINVECDGAEFHHHNVTMAQYQADRERDRFVESQGIEVLRFTGTEIWVSAQQCADTVALLMKDLVDGDR
jgi:very-short-patch-repair endonuclease